MYCDTYDLTEIHDFFVAIDVDSEELLHFDDQLKTQQTRDSIISMVDDQGEKDEKTDNDKYYEELENLIKYYKTVYYLKELRTFFLSLLNT